MNTQQGWGSRQRMLWSGRRSDDNIHCIYRGRPYSPFRPQKKVCKMLHTGSMMLSSPKCHQRNGSTNCYLLLSPNITRHARQTPAIASRRLQREQRAVVRASSSDSTSADGEAFDLAHYYEAKLENGALVDTGVASRRYWVAIRGPRNMAGVYTRGCCVVGVSLT